MPHARSFIILIALAIVPLYRVDAQHLPFSATPRGVIYTFLTETASPVDSIDRGAFRGRLVGDLLRSDPRSFKGMLPIGARIAIDSIPDLGEGDDGLRRVAAYITVEHVGERENWYFFCAGDSIWRIESFRRFPTPSQRVQIRASLDDIDTTTPHYRLLRADLQRMLLPDDSLRALFRRNRADIDEVIDPLRKGKRWQTFQIRDVDFERLEEYRELDDDINPEDIIFYTIDRRAMERLKSSIGLRRIERDPRHPDLIFFVVGSIEPSSYGYLHASNPGEIPRLSPEEFITLKPIGEGWWLYKRLR